MESESSILELCQRKLGDQTHTYYQDVHHKKQGPYIAEFHTMSQPATVHEIRYYKENVLDGPITTFYPTKKVARVGNYKDGEKHGIFQYYDSNGVLAQVERYKKGERHGTWQTFHADGIKSSQKKYRHDVQVDLEYGWDLTGKLTTCINTRH